MADFGGDLPLSVPEVRREDAVNELTARLPSWSGAVEQSAALSDQDLAAVYWTQELFDDLRRLQLDLARAVPALAGVSVRVVRDRGRMVLGVVLRLAVARSAFEGAVPRWWRTLEANRDSSVRLGDLWELFQRRDPPFRKGRRRPYPSPTWEAPVLLEADEFEPHGMPHPVAGTAACYARTRCSTEAREGLLTARHVADAHTQQARGRDAQIGDLVPAGPGVFSVVDLPPPGVDAVLLDHPVPDAAARFEHELWVALWSPAWIITQHGTVATKVRGVTDTYDVWHDPRIIAFVELLHPASPGDSGSLVVNRDQRGVGLYLGAAPHGGATGGRAAHLGQVCTLMEAELYR